MYRRRVFQPDAATDFANIDFTADGVLGRIYRRVLIARITKHFVCAGGPKPPQKSIACLLARAWRVFGPEFVNSIMAAVPRFAAR